MFTIFQYVDVNRLHGSSGRCSQCFNSSVKDVHHAVYQVMNAANVSLSLSLSLSLALPT